MGWGDFLTKYSIYFFSESISDAVVMKFGVLFFFLSLLFVQPRQNAAEEKMDRK